MMVTRGKGDWEVKKKKDKGGQIYDDGRRVNFGWWIHSGIYRWYIIELYT